MPAGVYKLPPARYYKNMSNHIDPGEPDLAYESYFSQVWGLLLQSSDEDEVWDADDTISAIIEDFYGDGSDPVHPEKAERRIIDELGL